MEDLSSIGLRADPITRKEASKSPDIHHRLGALLDEPFAAKGCHLRYAGNSLLG